MMEIIDAYAIIVNSDETEGRGVDVIYGYCKTRAEADIISLGKDVMGTKGGVIKVKILHSDHDEYISFATPLKTLKAGKLEYIKFLELSETEKQKIQNSENKVKKLKNKLTQGYTQEEISLLKELL